MRFLSRFVALVVLVHAAKAWACSCAGDPYDPVETMDQSATVFYGEVVSVVDPSLGCGCGRVSSMDPMDVTLRVIEPFKGVEADTEVVITTARDGASCGVEFRAGERWLIYTSNDRYGLCDPGGRRDADDPELQALRDR